MNEPVRQDGIRIFHPPFRMHPHDLVGVINPNRVKASRFAKGGISLRARAWIRYSGCSDAIGLMPNWRARRTRRIYRLEIAPAAKRETLPKLETQAKVCGLRIPLKTSCLLVLRLSWVFTALGNFGDASCAADSPPVITNAVFPSVVAAGTSVIFEVDVSGTPPLFYQWQRNGSDISGATNSIYVITNIGCPDSATFAVVVTNAVGTASHAGALIVAGCIQALVNAAAPGDTVTVPAGVFYDNVIIDRTIILRGAGITNTVIDGYRSGTVFTIGSNVTASLKDLSIANGGFRGIVNFGELIANDCNVERNAEGGIHNIGRAALTNCLLYRNTQQYPYSSGGGIYNGGRLAVVRSIIRQNYSGPFGSGAGIRNDGPAEIIGSQIIGNDGTHAGIDNYSTMSLRDCLVSFNCEGGFRNAMAGVATVTNCNFSFNRNSWRGGGIHNLGILTLVGSSVCSNAALFGHSPGNGGGIMHWGSNLTVINCTISGNYSQDGSGSAISVKTDFWPNPILTIVHSTICSNKDDYGGSAITLPGTNAIFQMRGTIVAGNTAIGSTNQPPDPNCPFTPDLQAYNLIPDGVGCPDPRLGPLQSNGGVTWTHALLPGSPAIDAGPPTDFPATDQRGILRPVDGNGDGIAISDIGAFELLRLTFAAVELTTDDQLRLRVAGGTPGQSCTIEGSDDLKTWTPLATLQMDANGLITAHVSLSQPQRFFRAVAP